MFYFFGGFPWRTQLFVAVLLLGRRESLGFHAADGEGESNNKEWVQYSVKEARWS